MNMKKLASLLLLSVFLIATVGVEVKAHYCDGVLMQVAVNGLHIHTAAGEDMPGCGGDDGCPACKNIYQSYKVQSHYGMGQVVLIQPSASLADWFHGDLPVLALAAQPVVLSHWTDVEPSAIYYRPRSHPWVALPQGGLRAPPVA